MKKSIFLSFFFLILTGWLSGQNLILNGNLGAVTTCSGTFYDSGGSGSNYQNGESYSVTIYPASSGKIQLNFTLFDVENMYDSLVIFDAATAVNPVANLSGIVAPFSVTATNPAGCLTLVWVSDNSVARPGWIATISCTTPAMSLSASVNNTSCNTPDGSIDLTVNGGVMPISYIWNTGDTTEDISALLPGVYIVNVMDSTGYLVSDTFYVNSSNLTVTPTITPTACDSTGGMISLALSGGNGPYTYTWNNGETGSSLQSNPAPGGYSVNIYDANGCFTAWAGYLVPDDSCTVTIDGYIFNDLNGNCVQDSGESPVVNAFLDITPGWATFTDGSGYYSIEVTPGNYTLTYYTTPFFNVSSCGAGFTQSLSLPNYGMNAYNTNFPVQFAPVQDLAVSLYEGFYVPGFNHTTVILATNNSSMTMSPVLKWTHDSIITPLSYSLPPTTYDPLTHTAEWSLPSIASLQSLNIYIQSVTDTAAQLGTATHSNVQIQPLTGDATPFNNLDTASTVVVGSLDPNQKRAYPLGEGTNHFISPNQNLLHYTVDFQNTGNHPAMFVIIRDTLDAALDAFTVVPGISSHPYTLTLENDNILVFRFDNINLPDSFSNEPESHGYVTYSVNTNSGLTLGTEIFNSAAIYFDFNAPIITNATQHTVYLPPVATIDQSGSICEGQDVTATVTSGVPPYNFSWTNGANDPNNFTGSFYTVFSSVGTYNLTVTDLYGTVSTVQNLVVEQVPSNAGFSYYFSGDTIFFTPNSIINAAYVWDFGNGQTSSLLYPYIIATEPEYVVSLSVGNLCGDISDIQNITVTGIEEDIQNHIRLFPNPATHKTELIVPFAAEEPYSVVLTDITGKVLQKWEGVSTERFTISVESLSAGTYFIEVKGKKHQVKKLVIQ